jgi:hypothetical protein
MLKSKVGKLNNCKIVGSNKTKGSKQDSQARLRSPIPEGGEPFRVLASNAVGCGLEPQIGPNQIL